MERADSPIVERVIASRSKVTIQAGGGCDGAMLKRIYTAIVASLKWDKALDAAPRGDTQSVLRHLDRVDALAGEILAESGLLRAMALRDRALRDGSVKDEFCTAARRATQAIEESKG